MTANHSVPWRFHSPLMLLKSSERIQTLLEQSTAALYRLKVPQYVRSVTLFTFLASKLAGVIPPYATSYPQRTMESYNSRYQTSFKQILWGSTKILRDHCPCGWNPCVYITSDWMKKKIKLTSMMITGLSRHSLDHSVWNSCSSSPYSDHQTETQEQDSINPIQTPDIIMHTAPWEWLKVTSNSHSKPASKHNLLFTLNDFRNSFDLVHL